MDIRYLAGLVDGEGCIALRKRKDMPSNPRPSYMLVVQIAMTHEGVIKAVKESIGGAMSEIKWHRRMNNRPAYQWRLYAGAAAKFLEDVLPYLIVKKDEAQLGISFQKHVDEYLNKLRHLPKERQEEIWQYRESVYWTMRNLKKLSGALDGMVANSVDTQNGQYRAKQDESPGVCNEHVPPSKEKMCSDLGRNVESAAETTVRLRLAKG